MDLIHDRANKFMNDVRKKKIKISRNKDNKDQAKQDAPPLSDMSNCFYCEKVFFNSKFLMRHILRRHSESLLVLYKKGLTGQSIFSSDDMKHLHSYIESEFVSLKNELKMVKRVVAGKSVENDTEASKDNLNVELPEDACNISENDIKINDDITEVLSNEVKNLAERLCELETNNQSLNNACKEIVNTLKTDVLRKQDLKEYLDINNEKILRIQESQLHELKQILLKDLQIIVSKQLYDNNNELKSQFSEVKGNLRRLDCEIAATNKRIDSPDFMKTVEEKYEHQLNVLIASMKHNSRVRRRQKSKPIVNHTAGEKMSNHNKANKKLSCRKDKPVSAMPQISPKELTSLVNEKLSYFGVTLNTSKMSCTEYAEKLKLINFRKEQLKMINPHFPEIYNSLNMLADHEVNSKLSNRKSRKVKFSEPLKSSVSAVKNSLPNAEKFQNKQYLSETQHLTTTANSPDCEYGDSAVLQRYEYIPESEGFLATDLNGGGDYTRTYLCNQNHYFKEASTVVKSISEFKNSPAVNSTQKPRKTENRTDSFEGASSSIKSVSDFKDSPRVNDTQKSKKTENQTDSFEGASSSTKSVSDFKISTSNDSEEPKKAESIDYSENSSSFNSLPSCSKKLFDWDSVDMQKSSYILKDYSEKNFREKENCDHNSDVSDFGGSVKSLSSWED